MPSLLMHAVTDTSVEDSCCSAGPNRICDGNDSSRPSPTFTENFGVTDVVGLNAIPMAVPHTWPSTITAHGSDIAALGDLPRWGSSMKLPASASMLLELRLAEKSPIAHRDCRCMYRTTLRSRTIRRRPRLLQAITTVTDLELPVSALENAATKMREQIDNEVSGNSEIESVVHALEEQYDSYTKAQESRVAARGRGRLPSGDELGAEFERFLAEQAGNGPDGNGDTSSTN